MRIDERKVDCGDWAHQAILSGALLLPMLMNKLVNIFFADPQFLGAALIDSLKDDGSSQRQLLPE